LQYAYKAIEIDPQDLDILRLLARQLHEKHQLDKAVEYLERATKSTRLKKDSATYVLLNLQLGALFIEMQRFDRAADAYAIVFDARRNPGKYNLDFQTRTALERERAARYELMGEIFLLVNRIDPAIAAFEEAVKSRGGRGTPANFSLATAHFRAKHFDQALKHLQIYLDAQLQGKGRRPYELLAEILRQTGKGGELLGRIEALAKKDPRNSTLQYFYAEQLLAADHAKQAEDLLQRTLKETGDVEGYIGLAAVYRKQNQPERVLDALAKGFKGITGPEDPRAERLNELLAEIQKDPGLIEDLIAAGRKRLAAKDAKPDYFISYLLGRLAIVAQKTDAAVEFYAQAAAARREIEARLAIEIAEHLVSVRRYQQASDILKKSLAGPLFPGGADGDRVKLVLLTLLSRAQELAGRTQDAFISIRDAQKLDNDNPELFYWEAWIYAHSHQWEEAIRRYDELIKKFAANKKFVRRCQFALSNCHVQKGDVLAGEKILEAVLAEQPDDPSTNNDLGYLYADQGKNLQRAEAMIRRAVKSEPDNVAYLDSMGWVLFKLGRLEEARSYLEKAVAQPTGSDATIWDHLGDCYDRLKERDKALDAWKKALNDAQQDPFPDKKLIQRIQEKLKGSVAEKK
jgi:tetratricopeptide (TPR) repeat protein